VPVRRFCRRLRIPTSTWYSWRAGHLAGRPVRRWPAPVVEAVEEPAAEQAQRYSAWGHRKVWAMLRADGVTVSQSSVYRALKRRDLVLPARYHAERRAMAEARKKAFVSAPVRRNRVWQTDLTRVEIASGSAWWIAPVCDYATKVCLAAPVSARIAGRDATGALAAAIANAEALLGHSLLEDCTDAETGELTPLIVVTDNGPAYKSDAFARFIAARPELTHVRTRHYAPQTNGVVERFNESLKYEHLYREEMGDGQALVEQVEAYRKLFNMVRSHESLGCDTPVAACLRPRTYSLNQAASVQES
jgi:transposase InsO family protein